MERACAIHWLVVPISITRDTEDPLTLSNWETILRSLKAIDPDGADHETHRFWHWGPGWFEIILVRPDSKCAIEAQECADAIESYPILDEHDFSEKEQAHGAEVWASMSVKERVEVMRRLRYPGSVLHARRDTLPPDECPSEDLASYLASHDH